MRKRYWQLKACASATGISRLAQALLAVQACASATGSSGFAQALLAAQGLRKRYW
jgi:hypothetical protein